MITLELLQELAPNTKADKLEEFVDPLNTVCETFEINTTERLAAFLAQITHESGGFNFMKENLNYSADGLLKVFGKYFPTQQLAQQYARNPKKIASRVYGGRMGNGKEETGEGWEYCGRGLIQITGKNNYTALAEDLNYTIEDTVDYLETVEGAVYSAGWFWYNANLNHYADNEDNVTITKKINGGTNGLQDRLHHYEVAKSILSSQEE